MRRLPQLAGIIAFAVLLLVMSPARADFITWNYGTLSGANGSFGEDKTYGGYIATASGADGLFINNNFHIPIGDLQFTAVGSVEGLRGWDISGPAVQPPERLLSFAPPNSTYWLLLEIEDGPAGTKNIFPAK